MDNTQITSPPLSRDVMDRLAAAQGCGRITIRRHKHGHTQLSLRYQGDLLYFGYLDVVAQLSEAEFTTKIKEKLASAERRQEVAQ